MGLSSRSTHHPPRSRRSSSLGRRSRHNSISSLDSATSFLVDDNNHEMFSGAASEIIPSSITSLHYPHHFGRFRSRQDSGVSRETSPLLEADLDQAVDDESVKSTESNKSYETQRGFKFFSPDEIELAPGGSTLENPEDPIDYNTNWDYSVDKYTDDAEPNELEEGTSLFHTQPGSSSKYTQNDLEYADTADMVSSYGSLNSNSASHFERRNRSDSGDSDKNDSLDNMSIDQDMDDEVLKDYPAVSKYQRYYLAEEDLVIGIAGYTHCLWKRALYYIICFATLGLGYLVLRWFPKYKVNLRGNKSALGKADWCVIENEFGELIIVDVVKQKHNERLSHFLAIYEPEKGTEDDGKVDMFEQEEADLKQKDPVIPYMHSFTYRYIKFFYNPVEDMFKSNSNWYDARWLNVKNTKEGVSQSTQEHRLNIFDENTIAIEEKTTMKLMMDEVLHPFYVFQVFSIILWLQDDYYYYASCIFLISVVSVANSLLETKRTIKRLQEISKFSCEVRVWRNGFWKQIESIELVPGDVFEVDPSLSIIPCDALLINGECVINESMLTGESVPVTKVSSTSETVQYLSENFTSPILAKSFLYNGTKLLKMKSPNDEPVTAMTVKTGFNTTKGSLVRSMLFPKPTGFKFYEDSFKYIGFMLMIAAIGFIYSTYNFIKLGIPKRIMILRALDIITIVVPPALPATLTIGTTFAINRLKSFQIFCIAPTRVNIGGKLDVICFDKTGTLTEDGLDVLGVHLANNARGRKEIVFEELVEEIKFLNTDTSRSGDHETDNGKFFLGGMATCHSLRLIDDELLGDPLDAKMFEFTKWNFEEESNGSNPIVYPKYESEGYQIMKEYEFVSTLRRMSVIANDGKDNKLVFTKGAPEVMSDICDRESLPANYEELLYKYTHNGFRVIALAYKQMESSEHFSQLSREEVESGLIFSGFIIFENKLKDSTRPTLNKLSEAKIRTVMCTGDNVLTAISVARESELIEPFVKQIYVPTYNEGSNETNLVWEEINNPEDKLDPILLKPLNSSVESGTSFGNFDNYKLAITGDVFRYLLVDIKNPAITQRMLMKCDIFARMSPDEKHELVEQLQKIDYTVGFCGDGANDCGALKAADVGISLSEAEASVAAPFTSRIFEISCVLDIIKEGRASLVTSFSCFKYMSLYSAIQFITVSILYKRGTNLGDFQFLYIDLFLILPLAIFMSWSKPFDKIVVKRPTANLVSPKVLVPLCCNILVLMIFQIGLWRFVQTQPWYIKPIPAGDDDVKSSDNTTLFLFTNFQYILIAMVLSIGPPYRQSFLSNYPFLVNLGISTLISTMLFAIDQDSWWGDGMQLTNLSFSFYCLILVAATVNFAIMWFGEHYWFKNLATMYKRTFQRSKLEKSRKLFKNLRAEDQLQSV